MAIFVFIAWVMELAEKVGIIREPQDPASRAYRAANHCLHVLKRELYDQPLSRVEASAVQRADGPVVACNRHRLFRDGHELADLGRGEVTFRARDENTLEVRIVSRMEDEAQHRLTVWIPVKGLLHGPGPGHGPDGPA
jgi:hypothetical protein